MYKIKIPSHSKCIIFFRSTVDLDVYFQEFRVDIPVGTKLFPPSNTQPENYGKIESADKSTET